MPDQALTALRYDALGNGAYHVDVAKWQTRQLEGLVLVRGWGFKSPHRHG